MSQPAALEDLTWAEDAQNMLETLAKSGKRFDANDLRRDFRPAPHPGMYGAAFKAAAERGLIVEVSRSRSAIKSSHGRRITVWQGADYCFPLAA